MALTLSLKKISLKEGATVLLDATSIILGGATDATFTVTGLAHGSFKNGSSVVTSFTLANVKAGLISFVHDGSNSAPTFTLGTTVATESASVSTSSTNLAFTAINDAAVITQKSFMLEEGSSILLRDMISITDEEDGTTALITASVSNGQILVNGTAAKTFTNAQVLSGAVSFAHDGSEKMPVLKLTVKDSGGLSVSKVITFSEGVSGNFSFENDAATISVGRVALTQGAVVKLGTSNIKLVDPDSVVKSAVITLTLDSDYTLFLNGTASVGSNFTYEQLLAGKVALRLNKQATAGNIGFSVNDGEGGISSGVLPVQIKFTQLPPVVSAGSSLKIQKGIETVLTDSFIAIKDEAGTPPAGLIISVANVKGGAFLLGGLKTTSFSLRDLKDGEVSFVHDAGITPSFSVKVANAQGKSSIAFSAFTIVVNEAPVITSVLSLAATEDVSAVYTATATDANSSDTLTYSLVGNAGHGSVVRAGNLFTYKGEANYSGADSFVVAVNDGSVTTSKTISVNVAAVADVAPTFTTSGALSVVEDGSAVLSVAATNAGGNPITYSLVGNGAKGSVTVSGSSFTYVANANANGSDSFVVQASDGILSTTQTVAVSISAVNDAPVFTSSGTLSAKEDTNADYTAVATDADGNSLTYSLLTNASNGGVTVSGTKFTYKGAYNFNGSDAFTVQVSDGTTTVTKTISVNVAAVNDAPVFATNPMLKMDNGYTAQSIFTVGENLPSAGGTYMPIGIPDGLGAYKLNATTMRVFVNHENSSTTGSAYSIEDGKGGSVSLTGARVSFVDVNTSTLQVVNSGLAYKGIIGRDGTRVDSVADLDSNSSTGVANTGTAGFSRFCSASMVMKDQFGAGKGIVDSVFMTGEENGNGSMWFLDAASQLIYAAPALGRGSWENAAQIDTGTSTHVGFLLGDDTTGAPLYLYIGAKNTASDASFLDRNGLVTGKLYYWKFTNVETLDVSDFTGNGTTAAGTWVEIAVRDQAKAGTTGYDSLGYKHAATLTAEADVGLGFSFNRIEDLSTNPANGQQIAFAATGSSSFGGGDTAGMIYRADLNLSNINAPTGSITILRDNNAAAGKELRNPDNLDWSADGNLYIQEDRSITSLFTASDAANKREASIVKLNPDTGALTFVAQVDRSVVPVGQTDSAPTDKGNWETSGIIDVSTLLGKTAGSVFLSTIQAHSVSGGPVSSSTLVEGGQLAIIAAPGAKLSNSTEMNQPLSGVLRVSDVDGNAPSFAKIGQIDLGNTGAAEISAFDPLTNRLFVVNNDGTSRVDIVDLSNPSQPVKLAQSINFDAINNSAGVNSVAISGGKLAAAIERKATSMLDTDTGYTAQSLFTVGEKVISGTSSYTPIGLLDGLGAYKLNDSTMRVYTVHENSSSSGATYTVEDGKGGNVTLTGARISFFDVNISTLQISNSGLAYKGIIGRDGSRLDSSSDLDSSNSSGTPNTGTAGLSRFCSASMVMKDQFGAGKGIVDSLFTTGEENGNGTLWFLDPVSQILHAAPDLGRGSWENIAQIDTGTTTHVGFLLGDDTTGAPLYLYIGEKSTSPEAGILARNGLANGKLYYWKFTNAETLDVSDFTGNGTTAAGTWVEIAVRDQTKAGTTGYDSLGYKHATTLTAEADVGLGFSFNRIEDLSTNPANGSQIVFAATGGSGFGGGDTAGMIYRADLNLTNLNAPTGSITILRDNNAAAGKELRNPDNLDWSADGNLYIQEDRSTTALFTASDAANKREASIVKLNPVTGELTYVAQVDRSAIPAGQTDSAPADKGNWETSGIIDVSSILGKAAGSVFLSTVQAHSLGGGIISSGSLVEGGQLAIIAAPGVTLADTGKVLPIKGGIGIYDTTTLAQTAFIEAGTLPDMVTFSADGRWILSANEGEPETNYQFDPIGSVTLIDTANGNAATTLDFASFESQLASLKASGFRIKSGASFAADIEPEYIAVSSDSKTAWVTLQENNGVARIDLATKTITNVFGLGYKDHSLAINSMDPSDKDNTSTLKTVPVKGLYMPDGIAAVKIGGKDYFVTANEGDTRDYAGSLNDDEIKVSAMTLDPTAYPNAAALKADAELGRLVAVKDLGDTDGDGDYDQIYTFGGRSFSIWDGDTGALVYDSGNDLETKLLALRPDLYDDTRSDNKGVEPEGVSIFTIAGRTYASIGLERADAVMTYDISNPLAPVFVQLMKTGDAPEGVLAISDKLSPDGQNLFVSSSEGDGMVFIYRDIANLSFSSSAPSHGSVVLDGGRYTYTPEDNYTGADSFLLTATDSFGDYTTTTINITVSYIP